MLIMKSVTSTDRPARTYSLASKESRSTNLKIFLVKVRRTYIKNIVYDKNNADLNFLKIG